MVEIAFADRGEVETNCEMASLSKDEIKSQESLLSFSKSIFENVIAIINTVVEAEGREKAEIYEPSERLDADIKENINS